MNRPPPKPMRIETKFLDMDKLFLCFLLPFLMCEEERQNRQKEISNLPDNRSDENDNNTEKADAGRDNLPAEKKEDTEVKDEFEYFPIGYLSDMYFVQADVAAENIPPVDAFHKRSMAHIVVKNHEKDVAKAEQAIVNLFITRGVDRECMKVAIQDYCDHLCELIDSRLDKSEK